MTTARFSRPPSGSIAAKALVVAPGVVAVVIAGGLGLRRDGLTTGEAATVYAARLSWSQLGRLIRHVDLVHATYYAAMHVLVLLGGGPVVLRLVSLVASVLAAALIALLGRRLSGSAISGTLAGLAFALCPTVDGFAKTARSYGVLPLLVVLTLIAFVHAVRTNRRASWLLYGVALLVTVYVHELSLLLVAAFFVVFFGLRAGRAVWTNWMVASVVVGVLAAPLVYFTHRESHAVGWITSPGPRGLYLTARTFAGPSPVALAVFGVGAAAAIVAAVIGWRRDGRGGIDVPGDRTLLAVALPVAVVPAVLLVLESAVAMPLFDTRYVSYYQPAAALVVAHGWAQLGRALVGLASRRRTAPAALAAGSAAAVGVLAVALALVAQLPLLSKPTTPRGYFQDYGAVEHHVLAGARPGDGIAYLPGNLHYIPDGYPRLRHLDDFAQRVTPTHAGNYQGRSEPIDVVLSRMARLQRIWVVSKSGTSWLTADLRAERGELRARFRPVQHWPANGLTLTLWVRRHT